MNKFILSFLLIIFMATPVFSASECITGIDDVFRSEQLMQNGDLTDHPRNVSFVIEPGATKSGYAVIEVMSGGYDGAGRSMYINVDTALTLNLRLNRETAPLYIMCHRAIPTPSSDGSVGWLKEGLEQSFYVSVNEFQYMSNFPADGIVANLRTIGREIGTVGDAGDSIASNILIAPTRFEDMNFTDNYEVIENDDAINLFFGGILLIIGLFGTLTVIKKFF